MPTDKNQVPPLPSACGPHQHELDDNALALGLRKKPCITLLPPPACNPSIDHAIPSLHQDPYVSHGRHFGRTIHALCRVQAIINNGLFIQERLDLDGEALQTLLTIPATARQHAIFEQLMKITPNFREVVFTASQEEITRIADLQYFIDIPAQLQKGANGARSDDTKSLKGAVIEWITPKGQALSPPLTHNIKIDRGFHHERTGFLLCPTGLNWQDAEVKEKLKCREQLVSGDEWPVFIYHGYIYDPKDPWNGAFRSLLLKVFKHIFTSPSSVNKDPKVTQSRNAHLHDMTSVTAASIAYVATQVFMDPDESNKVVKFLGWWNRQIFPGHSVTSERIVNKDSALARIKARHAQRKALQEVANTTHV
ncbi:hypothetical protein DXG01_006388 [Tephrocybe rancida]|nr:hypothetical protein DXG01_006388 [Tephrocybe rancida]